METHGKTLSYWWEKFGGLLLGIIAFVIIWFINPIFSNWKPFIVEFTTIGMCAFGFLLTLLGIILQGNSDTITWMMSWNELYNRFISFNKRIVIISFVLSLYSYIIGYVNFQTIKDLLCPQLVQIAENIMIGVFGVLLVWFINDTFRFIILFYELIRKTEKK